MRILFITHCSVLYGANRSLIELIETLQKNNIQCNVWIPEAGPIEEELCRLKCRYRIINYCNGVYEVGHYNQKQAWYNLKNNIKNAYKYKELIKTWKIDIIHTNTSINLFGAFLAIMTGKPHIWHIREMMLPDYHFKYDYPRLSRFLLKRADKVIFISNATRQYWEKTETYRNAIVRYNGFNLDKYIAEKENDMAENKLNLLMAGAISQGKGSLEAVKAIKVLVKRNIKNIHLRMVGEGTPEYVGKIRQYIARNKIEEYVEIISFQKNLSQLRRRSDIALMCSKKEALGRVTIESMAGKLLVIASDSGGTKELVKDGITGYLYESGNYNQLADKIEYALNHWSDVPKITDEAQKFVINKFAVENYAAEMINIYKNAIKKRV